MQGVSLVLQGQHPLAPAEELGKGLGKGRPDLGKLGAEALVHLLGDAVDDPFQRLPGGLHIVLLVREVLPALFHALKFLHSPQVHVAQGGDVVPESAALPLGLARVRDVLPYGLGALVGHAVGVPQAVQQTVFLGPGLQDLLLGGPGLPLQLEL